MRELRRCRQFYLTYPGDSGVADSRIGRDTAAASIYAGFPSGIVIVSDIQRGLFVLRPE